MVPPPEPRQAPGPGGALPEPFEPWRTESPRRQNRRRWPRIAFAILAGLTAVSLIAVAAIVLWPGADDESGDSASQLARPVFATDPSAKTDGRNQELNGVAATGSTVVAAGGESDAISYRAQFLVSTNGGRTFQLASVRTTDGEEPGFGEVPRHVAASSSGWVALGDRPGGSVLWTSQNGQEWVRHPDNTVTVFSTKDRVARVIADASGFIAVGSTSEKGDFSDAAPVLWLSQDGRLWERHGADQLGLDAKGGTVTLVGAAAQGSTIIVQGVRTAKVSRGKKPEPRNLVWRSNDRGRSWKESSVPAPKGTIGLTITTAPSGFIAIREIGDKDAPHSTVFTSSDAGVWREIGKIEAPGYRRLQRVSSSSQGMAAIVGAGEKVLLLRSQDGASWQQAGEVVRPASRSLPDVAVTPDHTVVIGRDAGDNGTDSVLAVRDVQGQEVPLDLTKVTGAVQPDQMVNGVMASGGRVMAVGSANGDAAAWTSSDGRKWQRAQPVGTAFARPGAQWLNDITAGGSGWLAVGFDAVQPWRPLVATSADGTTWESADGGSAFKPRKGVALATHAAAAGTNGYVIVGDDGPAAAAWFSTDLKTWNRASGVSKIDLADGRWMRGVVGGPFGYVAVGGVIDPKVKGAAAGRPAVWTSADGRQWKLSQLPLPTGMIDGSLPHIAVKGNQLVATGTATTQTGLTPIAYVSGDAGKSWQATRLPTPDQGGSQSFAVTTVGATPRGFTVAGITGKGGATDVVLWTSPDGRTWTMEKAQGTGLTGRGEQEVVALTVIGNDLLAVGSSADHRDRQPTLWRKPIS
jgi:hypothetical protein